MTSVIISNYNEKYFKNRNESEKTCITIKQKLLEIIWQAYCSGYTDFYTNCEFGIPLWSAEIICALKLYNKIYLHIVIPYEEQCLNWCEEWRNRYYDVHSKADSVIFVNKCYHENCHNDACKTMINHGDTVFVFGKQSNKSYAEKYAQSINTKIKYYDFIL